MIQLGFDLGGDTVVVKIEGNNITFTDTTRNLQNFVPIDCLRLPKEGILKEFPELKNLEYEEMRKEAISRFKGHIKNMESEGQVAEYVKDELMKQGYVFKFVERGGWRKKKQ